MDAEQAYGIHLRRAVYIEGITASDTDEQITEFCSVYGSVSRMIRVRQTGQENGVKALVEFESDESVANLVPNLPQYLPSMGDPNIMWRIDRAYGGTTTRRAPASPVRAVPVDLSDCSSSASEVDSDDSKTLLICKSRTRSHPVRQSSPTITT